MTMEDRKECECLTECPFFKDKMINRPGTAEIYKDEYCRKDNSRCARYLVFRKLGKQKIPPGLFPNQIKKARKIISKK